MPSNSDGCKRITQQAGDEYGIGSINWMNAAPNVDRWAWYSTFNSKPLEINTVTLLMDEDANLTPLGRAMMGELDPTTDCDAPTSS